MAEIHQSRKEREAIPARISPEPKPITWKPWPEDKIELGEYIDCPTHDGLRVTNKHTVKR